jgi:hypothetical protein
MASRHRENKVMAAVACPTCGAPRGAVCRQPDGRGGYQPRMEFGRPLLCSERRAAWKMVRDGEVK